MATILPHPTDVSGADAQPAAPRRASPELSQPADTIMRMDNVGFLLLALLIGVVLGASGAWLALR
ncbi:MAG: hypothetical protein WAW78_05765, partial [Propioniciclava sp.]